MSNNQQNASNPYMQNQQMGQNPYMQNGGFTNQGHANQGYQNQGYQNQGFQNQGFQNQGFQNQGFQNQGYQNQGYYNQNYPKQPFDQQAEDNKTLCIIGLCLGIFSVLGMCLYSLAFPAAVAAIALGIVALKKDFPAKNMALIGMILGCVSTVILVIAYIFMLLVSYA